MMDARYLEGDGGSHYAGEAIPRRWRETVTSRGTSPPSGHWTRRARSRLGEALNVARGDFAFSVPIPELQFDLNELEREDRIASPAGTIAGPGPAFEPAASVPLRPRTAEDMVVDLRPPSGYGGPAPRPAGEEDFGLGREWGSSWRWTTQGWVDKESGNPRWRPVVTTTTELSNWEPDTYLGIVSGEASVNQTTNVRLLGDALARARTVALESLVEAAVARGAHAVIGTAITYTPVQDHLLVTATGTAVTLRDA